MYHVCMRGRLHYISPVAGVVWPSGGGENIGQEMGPSGPVFREVNSKLSDLTFAGDIRACRVGHNSPITN